MKEVKRGIRRGLVRFAALMIGVAPGLTACSADGVTDANPGGPIVPSVKEGTFKGVRLTSEAGVAVKRTLSGDGTTWSAGSGSFGTGQPKGTRKAKVNVADGAAGAEVFVKDKASVERALKVETSVSAEYGVSLGGGLFGANDVSASFTIGREQTVEANTRTHRLIV
ncbi:MAG: hypothetical protein QOI78_213 [Actinomycetota bacterium]|jgi:hypothetical protein|nr:hypothetical protein [Actinomycetota bacterium]